jgi:hypothetical protein
MEDTNISETQKAERFTLTNNKDTDLIILSKLNDKDLLNACLTNKSVNKACKDENFWRLRFIETFDKKFPVKPGYDVPSQHKSPRETWRNFYLKFLYYTDRYQLPYDLLKKAASTGDLSLIVYALNRHPEGVNEALDIVVILEKEEAIKYLVSHGSNATLAIRWASGYGSLDLVKFLVEHGANIRISNDFPLRMAGKYGRFDVVKYLIEHGADIHARNDEILKYAARYGNIELIKFLLDQGSNINRINKFNLTPLSTSIYHDRLDTAKYLLDRGANIDAGGGVAIYEAAKSGNLNAVKFLIEKGANPNLEHINKDNETMTPIEIARKKGHYDIVKYLTQILRK